MNSILVATLTDQIEQLKAKLRECKRWHYYCDDCWYACPKSEDGCCDESKGTECNCGAEEFNRELEEFLAKFD